MTVNFVNILLSGGAALLGAIAGWISTFVAMRKGNRDYLQKLIEQLQEERNTYADSLKEEREMYSAKLDKMWKDKSMSRRHVAALEDHIWSRKPPPPPLAPEDYIH